MTKAMFFQFICARYFPDYDFVFGASVETFFGVYISNNSSNTVRAALAFIEIVLAFTNIFLHYRKNILIGCPDYVLSRLLLKNPL